MDFSNYQEYKKWLEDNKEFIQALEKKAPNLSTEFELEFYVLDTMYDLAKEGNKLDEDHDDVFFLGFDYLSYVYSSLELLAQHIYENNLELMDQHFNDVIAYIYMDSLTLNVDMELNVLEGDFEEVLAELNNIIEEAEQLLTEKEEITIEFVESLEDKITDILDEYEIDIYLDDVLLFEYASEHDLIEVEEEE